MPEKMRGDGLIQDAVGPQCQNLRDDVKTVQLLLNHSAAAGRFQPGSGPLDTDGRLGQSTRDAIEAFQQAVLGHTQPDGRVATGTQTLHALCSALPEVPDEQMLMLLYLRSADGAFAAMARQLIEVMKARDIGSPLRQAHFLAQIGHESGCLRFRAELASGEAYEGRQDLGNLSPGDGRKYKGRGLIQLTGRTNYAEYGRAIGREAELLANPSLIESDAALCADVAGWFWARRNLNELADKDDLNAITRRINGGLNGIDERRGLLFRAKALLM